MLPNRSWPWKTPIPCLTILRTKSLSSERLFFAAPLSNVYVENRLLESDTM